MCVRMKWIIVFALIAVLIGLGYHKFHELTRPLPVPKVNTKKYWGPGHGSKYKADETIKPFKIHYTEEISDLRSQLNRTLKLAKPLEGTNFEYGFNTVALKLFVNYWRDKYLTKWNEREEYLNSLPQFTTEIQGLRIHFIHAKPKAEALANKKVLPLLLLHGWPGSVREFYDFIPLLTESNGISDYVFEVIAPSLVGYGWSEPAAKPGFNAAHMATVMRNLMLRVGHKKFLVQGGDWGSVIGSDLATLYPENVLGYHSNTCMVRSMLSTLKYFIASFYPERFLPSRVFAHHHFPLLDKLKYLQNEFGYFHIQATKPDTIGTVLQQNPVGLASYILGKFQSLAGPANEQKFEGISTAYGLEAVLDNVMIYYLTNTATTSVRFYAETMSKEYLSLQMDRVPTPVPTGCVRFSSDFPSPIDWQLKDKYPNFTHSSYFNNGGNFVALQLPVKLYIDFNEFVTKIKSEQ